MNALSIDDWPERALIPPSDRRPAGRAATGPVTRLRVAPSRVILIRIARPGRRRCRRVVSPGGFTAQSREYLRHRHRWSAHQENPDSHIVTKASDAESVRQAVELEFPEWMRLKWSKFDDKLAEMLHPRFAAKADYFLRFEELPASFRAWMAERGVPGSIELGHDNVTSRERDYRPYYDEATRQLLERVYRFYLRRFQYSFA